MGHLTNATSHVSASNSGLTPISRLEGIVGGGPVSPWVDSTADPAGRNPDTRGDADKDRFARPELREVGQRDAAAHRGDG